MHISFFWRLGEFLCKRNYRYEDICRQCSKYLSYYYGNSYRYSLSNIHRIRKFYSYFPIYFESMSSISWDSYLLLLDLCPRECYFYFHILCFCGDDFAELKRIVQSDIYNRIKDKS